MTDKKQMEAVLAFREGCTKSDTLRDKGLTTPEDIVRFDNISYGPYGDENLLDIYIPKQAIEADALLPAIINVHGGGWVYGNKEVYQFYCMSLAQRGFTVVNINYRLAPENIFPAAVEDINSAVTFVCEHGHKYHADKDRLVMVGDSAGGQLVSHYGAIFTNPKLAELFDVKLPNGKLCALGLNCGAYFEKESLESGQNDFFNIYTGYNNSKEKEMLIKMLDTPSYITANYPPSFVMSAQNDFLLPMAEPMYEVIKAQGVPCTVKIYGTKEQAEIAHVFHVNIRFEEATRCNDDECEFFKKYC